MKIELFVVGLMMGCGGAAIAPVAKPAPAGPEGAFVPVDGVHTSKPAEMSLATKSQLGRRSKSQILRGVRAHRAALERCGGDGTLKVVIEIAPDGHAVSAKADSRQRRSIGVLECVEKIIVAEFKWVPAAVTTRVVMPFQLGRRDR